MGDRVTVSPPYDGDPIVVSMQPHATVAEVQRTVDGPVFMVVLGSAYPSGQQYGPFPAQRLIAGW